MAVNSSNNNSNKKKNTKKNSNKKQNYKKKNLDNETNKKSKINVENNIIQQENIDDTIKIQVEIQDENNKLINNSNELIKKETTTLDNDSVKVDDSNNNELLDKKNIKKENYLIRILALLFVASLLYFIFIPRISLLGNKTTTINYYDDYIEPGYKATFIFKNITKNIKVDNSIINGKIGNYKVVYYYKIGFLKFKKTRNVKIVDNKKPEVLLDDEITLCPNDDISKIKYEVFDEYDGDITDKAISNYTDNKLIISASDKSNNKINKEIIIKKEDNEKPVITLKGNETIYLYSGSNYTEPGFEAIDNCDGNITDKVTTNGNVGSSVGTYKITYSVSDNTGNKTEVIRTVIIKNNNLYNSGNIGNGTIYLTFDDGPSWGTTNVILDVLKEEGVVATFFVTCNGPDSLIKRMYDEGHTVALHTASHNYSYIYSSVDNYFADLNKVSNRVKNITGIESKIIRFPGGSSNTVSRQYKSGIMTELTGMVLDKGYRYFDWNVDSNDAGSARSSSDVYNNVVWNLSKSRSNVVLMHDIKYTTRDAIRNIIKYGKANGYSFNKIDMNTYMVRHGVNN